MKNDTYVFEGLQTVELVSAGFDAAISLCKSRGVTNIKLVVQDFNYQFDFVAEYMEKYTGEGKEELVKRFTNKGYRIEKDGIGINVISTGNFHYSTDTVFLFLTAYESTFSRVKKAVIGSNYPVILCVPEGSYDNEFKALLADLNIISHTIVK